MRSLLTLVLIFAVIIGGVAIYLISTTPDTSPGVKLPLTAEQRILLASVPAAADSFAFIPTAAPLQKKLLANPVTRDPFQRWLATQAMPSPWMLGGADVVAWRDAKRTGYAIRVDAFRAFLVRIWMMWSSGNTDARWDGTAFVINDIHGARMPVAQLEPLLAAAKGLPAGDLLVVQVNRSRGVFPPIGRPAATSVKIDAREILLVSRAEEPDPVVPHEPLEARFPKGAMLAATFADPPRLLGDLQRLTGTDVGALVSDGGSIVLYDIETGTLLPRPRGLVSVPATDARRAAMGDVNRMAELVGQTRDTGKELLVSFDRTSLPLYLKDAFEPATWPATSWAVRLDPQKMVPVLEKLGDSTGLRLASGRLHRAARDLRRWIGALEQAESIEAAASTDGRVAELRVRIASK